MSDSRYLRQAGMFNPTDYPSVKAHIFGLGTIGSFTALCLAKMGIERMELYDFDTVSEHNTSNQLYPIWSIGAKKTETLAAFLRDTIGTTVGEHDVKIAEDTLHILELTGVEPSDIVVMAFDNLKARRLLYAKLKEFVGVNIIDARMSGEDFRVFAFKSDDAEKLTKYEDTLNPVKLSEIPCGERSISYNAFSVAGVIGASAKKLVKNEPCPFETAVSLRGFAMDTER